ncbi:maleylpyruvate isomerase family mycothiol-dependent enzyme [Nonomuraea sp. NEAU-A123]|uniref:maleylpyruvate isomerase family mycothiol-dependent enzyme n=1 Tax=Nonomuraea sp. NEAU-A123 TaxID=2839649 RepID=UPI001BE4CFB4|nr:maleylpyruvate isomerase family mycothiol-dependent enzyme [Nonomuraea sp. NEAU-A123]MBT2226716.1 maleylpyruvate isomerase family mycothiol-dependent enzyme [Nonomuraea sp. NEAU-A123]
MDHLSHFGREIRAFEAAVRAAGSGLVPSCPGWGVPDLVMHLGGVHRYLAWVIGDRLTEQPDPSDLSFLGLPAESAGWPDPAHAPATGPLPAGLADWFAEGAARLESLFATTDPNMPVWTWSGEQRVRFWVRMQSIEAAVHRWDAEGVAGTAGPMDAELAADAVGQTFEVMAPARRAWTAAPPGAGESYGFRQTDGPARWTVRFDGPAVKVTQENEEDGRDAEVAGAGTGDCDVEVAGTASDLMLFLWQRVPPERMDVRGDRAVLDRYFTLVPPV